MFAFEGSKKVLRAAAHAIHLDCAGETAFISHAHADHTPAFRPIRRVLASTATLDLLRARGYGKRLDAVERASPAGAELLGAGHILGASQLRAPMDGGVFTYAGDFKPSDSLTVRGAVVRACDTLLMEATYGSPSYAFPPADETRDKIASWVRQNQALGRTVLLGGYELGKAQELVKLLNDYAGVAPVVPGRTAELCRVYARHGVPLDFVDASSDEGTELLRRGESFVGVVPLNYLRTPLAGVLREDSGKAVVTAAASGWALHSPFSFCDASFPLSDHADYNELVQFALETGAKRVFCAHGHAAELALALRRHGIDARAVDGARAASALQKTLVASVAAGE